jgi:L-iditol 2-dehydrogenase
MIALEITEPGVLNLCNRPDPIPGSGEVLIRGEVVGICHSDIEVLEGKFITPLRFPLIPGHEWVGTIVSVGLNIHTLAPGDRVVGDCRVGVNDYFGLNRDGAAAELFLAREDWLYKVPTSMSSSSAALIEPFTVGYYGVYVHGGVKPGAKVVILGAGAIGLCSTAIISALGAEAITIDPNPDRRSLALRMGASHVLAPSASLEEDVLNLTNGQGADLVLEASGASSALAVALKLVRQFGQVTYIGFNIGEIVTSELGLIQSKDLTVRGITGSPEVWPAAIELMLTKKIDLTPLVTSTFPLSQAQEAFDRVSNREDIKVHIIVNENQYETKTSNATEGARSWR